MAYAVNDLNDFNPIGLKVEFFYNVRMYTQVTYAELVDNLLTKIGAPLGIKFVSHKKSNPDFAREWDEALDVAADTLEDEARRRAVDGIEEPVFHKGEKVGTVRKYSDVLLIFLLKGIRPQKYRETRATMAPAELNKLIDAEFERRAKEKEREAVEPVN